MTIHAKIVNLTSIHFVLLFFYYQKWYPSSDDPEGGGGQFSLLV